MRLRLLIGDEAREMTFTDRQLVVAGRAPDCTVRIDGDPRVSRYHCVFHFDPPLVRLRDLGSQNGTYVGGERIGATVLDDGEEVRIGDTTLMVGLDGGEPAPAAAPGPARGDLAGRVAALGRYEIVRELSRGGMGAVFLADDRATGAQVAVKVMLPEVAADERNVASFLREIENVRTLDHPHIARFHDAGTSDGTIYLALEYCPSGTLFDAAQAAGGRLTTRDAVEFAMQALEGLAWAHDAPVPHVELADGNVAAGRGIVHRDVKPQNLLLDAHGRCKVTDFGLSKALDKAGLTRHTRTGMVGGSPAFMARAQLIDYRYARPEVDVWSVAATLYWLLTGSLPRDFAPGADPMLTVLEQDAVPIRARGADLPPALADVVDHALTETPHPGFRTALELRDALYHA